MTQPVTPRPITLTPVTAAFPLTNEAVAIEILTFTPTRPDARLIPPVTGSITKINPDQTVVIDTDQGRITARFPPQISPKPGQAIQIESQTTTTSPNPTLTARTPPAPVSAPPSSPAVTDQVISSAGRPAEMPELNILSRLVKTAPPATTQAPSPPLLARVASTETLNQFLQTLWTRPSTTILPTFFDPAPIKGDSLNPVINSLSIIAAKPNFLAPPILSTVNLIPPAQSVPITIPPKAAITTHLLSLNTTAVSPMTVTMVTSTNDQPPIWFIGPHQNGFKMDIASAPLPQAGQPTPIIPLPNPQPSTLPHLAVPITNPVITSSPTMVYQSPGPFPSAITMTLIPWSGTPPTLSPALQAWGDAIDVLTPIMTATNTRPLFPNTAQPTQMAPLTQGIMAALRSGEMAALLPDTIKNILKDQQKSDILSRLSREAGPTSTRQETGAATGEWRSMIFPLQFDGPVMPVTLHMKRGSDHENKNRDQGQQGQRFILDLDFDRMGAVQVDLLYRPGQLDTVLRTETGLSMGMRDELSQKYAGAMTKVGHTGTLSFQDGLKSWVKINVTDQNLNIVVS